MPSDHHDLIARMGSEAGARDEFERLITALAETVAPGVRPVRADPGDWGIDAFIGQLDNEISVWQAKFFVNAIEDSQKQQIRDSFASARGAATNHGYTLAAWTLCIPRNMSAPEAQWWDGWKATEERDHGVKIELCQKADLDRLLRSPDAEAIRDEFFPPRASPQAPIVPVRPLPPDMTYEEMLFIKQLQAAQIVELDAAREQFFNAELLAREVQDKAVPAQLAALGTMRAEVRSIWSVEFNDACSEASAGNLLPKLHGKVMRGIAQDHYQQQPAPLRTSVVHRFGAMHQVVDQGAAGWVRRYREIAEQHGT